MILRLLLAVGLIFVFGISAATDGPSVIGKNGAAFGTARDVTISNDNSLHISLQTTKIDNTLEDSRLNSFQRHQDALLVAEHPTKVKAVDAEFLHWYKDLELFLSVKLKNISKLTAYRVEQGIPDPLAKGSSKKVRYLNVALSANIPKEVRLEYAIEPGEEMVRPLIGIVELRHLLNLAPSYCIVTARVVDGERKFPELPFKQGQMGTAVDWLVSFTFTYRSIFDQKYLSNSPLSVIVAKRDTLVPPGPNDGPSYLRCLD